MHVHVLNEKKGDPRVSKNLIEIKPVTFGSP